MQRLPKILVGIAVILSHAMCAVVAWEYCSLIWEGRYAGASAPAYTAFFSAVPFGAAIAACLLLAKHFRKGKQ